MLILLPPSEGKNEPATNTPLSLDSLSFASELTSLRREAITQIDHALLRAPAAPAIEVYSGVLYQALDWQTLSRSAQSRGEKELLIFSALFGILRPCDSIPHYKAKIKSTHWKSALSQILDDSETDLIVDCRSSTYATVWRGDPAITVAVRVYQLKSGKLSVITHMSKKYRGELTRLLFQKKAPKNPEQLAAIASEKYHTRLTRSIGSEPWYLDLIIPLD